MIAVNDSWRLLPSCEHLYACDYRWWKHHIPVIRSEYRGICWTQDVQWNDSGCTPAAEWGIRQLKSLNKPGLSKDPGVVHQGGNSGYQALNLAGHLLNWSGRVLLLGYDMQLQGDKRHWFGAHPNGLEVGSSYVNFIAAFGTIDPAKYGIEVWNLTRKTALQHFKTYDLDEVCAAFDSAGRKG